MTKRAQYRGTLQALANPAPAPQPPAKTQPSNVRHTDGKNPVSGTETILRTVVDTLRGCNRTPELTRTLEKAAALNREAQALKAELHSQGYQGENYCRDAGHCPAQCTHGEHAADIAYGNGCR